MQRRTFLTSTALACTSMGYAQAQAWPDRPLKIFQGFAAGGNADAIARLIGSEISKPLGQAIVVEAQAGAGGTIAANTVARARPDGYTLLLATGGHAVAGALYNTLPYQTVTSFEAVCTITYFPFLLVTTAESRMRNFRDVVIAATAAPGTVAYGTAGIGSTHHLAGELLAKMAGVSLLHVPYRGDAASLTSLMAGDVPFIIAPPTAVLTNIKALGIPESKLNVAGGGIALGHPIGASGARVLTTLIHQLKRTGGKRGVAALCLGGGNSVAMVIEV